MANVDIKICGENLIFWGNMEDWDAGASAAPTEHTLSGAGASVAREATTIKQGTYSAAVTRSGADTTLYHDFPDYDDYLGRKMTFECWVYATVASRGRIAINDGVGTTASSYHTGAAGWEKLSVTRNIDSSATQVRLEHHVNTGNTTAYFDGGILVEGPTGITVLTSIADIGRFTPSTRYRGPEFTLARRQGVKVPTMQPESVTMKIEGMIVATTAATTRTNTDTLNNILNSQRTKPNGDREKKDLYLWDDRFVRGFLNSSGKDNLSALKVKEFDLNFIIPDPFEYFVQKLRSKQTISATPTTFTVTVNGNAISLPKITITNSSSNISSFTIQNLTTGQALSYTGTLITGDDLILDSDNSSVTNDGTDDVANATGDISTLYLLPGANEIKVTGLVSGTVKVDFFDRWYL